MRGGSFCYRHHGNQVLTLTSQLNTLKSQVGIRRNPSDSVGFRRISCNPTKIRRKSAENPPNIRRIHWNPADSDGFRRNPTNPMHNPTPCAANPTDSDGFRRNPTDSISSDGHPPKIRRKSAENPTEFRRIPTDPGADTVPTHKIRRNLPNSADPPLRF